ncbi:MAG: GTP cyclohydrolase II [Sphingosinicella sp.]
MTAGRRKGLEKAIDALRRGWPVAIDGEVFVAVESTDEEALAAADPQAAAPILVSGRRAATLKLTNQRDALPGAPVLIRREPWIDLAAANAIADPALDLASPLKGPFVALPVDLAQIHAAALKLARLAGLLPALFALGAAASEAQIAAADVMAAVVESQSRIVARARLPTRHAEQAEIVAFRGDGDPAEHVALLIGSPEGRVPLVRIHSECLTGDVLGSLKCDCGPQLEHALGAIAAAGWGILLYLRQEGRAIGHINKLRAYALQDQGFDTYEANLRLGFEEDERGFAAAAGMLRALGQQRVRLLTNNPGKGAGLEAEGIEVAETVPLSVAAGPHNQAYLEVKRRRGGHLL